MGHDDAEAAIRASLKILHISNLLWVVEIITMGRRNNLCVSSEIKKVSTYIGIQMVKYRFTKLPSEVWPCWALKTCMLISTQLMGLSSKHPLLVKELQ